MKSSELKEESQGHLQENNSENAMEGVIYNAHSKMQDLRQRVQNSLSK